MEEQVNSYNTAMLNTENNTTNSKSQVDHLILNLAAL